MPILHHTDVMCLAETCHDTHSVAFRRLRSAGYQVVDRHHHCVHRKVHFAAMASICVQDWPLVRDCRAQIPDVIWQTVSKFFNHKSASPLPSSSAATSAADRFAHFFTRDSVIGSVSH